METELKPAVRAYHPLLIALFPILSLYAHNAQLIPAGQIVRPLAVVLLAVLALWLLFRRFFKNPLKAALFLSLLILCFFFYTQVLDWIMSFSPDFKSLARHRYFLPPFVLLLVAAATLIRRARADLSDLTRVLNATSLVLVALPALSAVTALYRSRAAVEVMAIDPRVRRAEPRVVGDSRPDIYFILLDGYGRADKLRKLYNWDNTPFVRDLEKRGFYVAAKSRANYDHTQLALASSLNLMYLDDLARRVGKFSTEGEPLRALIDRNEAARFLRRAGYRYVSVWTGFDGTRVNSADLILTGATHITAFEGLLVARTPLAILQSTDDALHEQHRRSILAAFDHLAYVASLPGPTFTFAHILSPHPPFVFGPNGETVRPPRRFTVADASHFMGEGGTLEEYRALYPRQLAFVNKKVIAAVDQILARPGPRPVIVLLGDHGARAGTDFENVNRTDLGELYSNLTAYYVPEGVKKHLYPRISPVNTFRLLFTDLFGADLPLLPDRSYFAPSSHYFDFVEVTDQLKRGCQAQTSAAAR